MSQRLYLHVGLQKTGTSYLQSVFWQNKAELRAQGLDMVPGTLRRTFWLMLDVRGRFDPRFDRQHVGRSLERLPQQLAEAPGSRALTTEESLAPSTSEQIERLLAACGDREVHVILTVRDLVRQIPSSWQQDLQAGSHTRLAEHLDLLRATWDASNDPDNPHGPWRQKNAAAVAERWARHVPAGRIHVVTVPPSGSAPDELLRRFCEVVDVDPSRLSEAGTRPNEALSHVAAELLRRVNEGLEPRLLRRDIYGTVGKRYFAIRVLGDEAGEKVRLPAELEPWCRSVAQQQVDSLRAGGYDVVGDLEDLLPETSSFSAQPAVPTDAELVGAATRALSHLLSDELVRRREEKRENQKSRQATGSAAGAQVPARVPARGAALARRIRRVGGRVRDRLRREDVVT